MSERLVVDTNVVVAGLLTRDPASRTRALLDAMLAGRLGFLLSESLLAEYRAVLLRPKIAALHGLTEDEIDELLVLLAANAVIAEIADGSSSQAEPSSGQGAAGDEHLVAILGSVPEALLVTGDLRLASRLGRRAIPPRRAIARH